jgi:hypothetical protein
VARLQGKLANIRPDLPSERLTDSSIFKAITGCDRITEKHFRRIDGHANLWALAAILGRENKSTTQPSKEKVS